MQPVKNILFIQLPLISHSYDYITGNIEYAPASIAGYLCTLMRNTVTVETLPFVLSNYASDQVIVHYVNTIRPDILAFTCYLWNIERSLHIAEMVKNLVPGISIIFGGPEIQYGSMALIKNRHYVDYFVIGEGEWFFRRYLMSERFPDSVTNNNTVVIQPGEEVIQAEMIFEPFTGNRINTMPDGSMFFELTRGCPYRCSYCLYAKNSRTIREAGFEKLLYALSMKDSNRNLSELYILSPALNATANFTSKLEALSDIKHGVRLHSEMRADKVTPALASLLYRAGFRSLEIGLQTMNRMALEGVGRKSNTETELEGIHELMRAGIDIKIGLIPGLPGENAESFLSMIDRLVDAGLQDNLELYPLMLLPGTEIHARSLMEKINFIKKPPYYYNGGWGMSFDELLYINSYMEEKTGYSHITKSLPDFTEDKTGLYCRGIRFNGDLDSNWNIKNYIKYIQCSIFSFFIDITFADSIYRNLSKLIGGLPQSELFNIIVYCDSILDENEIISILRNNDTDSIVRRMYIFHEWKHGLRIRVHQVFDSVASYVRARDAYYCVVPILRIGNNNAGDVELLNDYEDSLLVSNGMFNRIRKSLKKFADSPESVAFENRNEQQEFYIYLGRDCINLPFTMHVIQS